MKRIINSPLKMLGSLTILLGLIAIIFTYGYLLILGLMIIGVGIIPFFVDKLISKKGTNWLTLQIMASFAYIIFLGLIYLNWQAHNEIEFENKQIQSSAIVFGISGYPELSDVKFWKRKIKIPESGFLITSTKANEISNSIKYKDKSNPKDWNPNYSYPCIINKGEIRAWIFNEHNDFSVTNDISELAEKICVSSSTKYKSNDGVIWKDETNGKYLWLQGKGINRLPDYVDTINVYKMILTDNNFSSVPKQVLNNQNLKELYLSKNHLNSIPTTLTKLTELRLLAINGNNISDIPDEIIMMANLEVLYIKNNPIEKSRLEEIKLMSPKLEIK